MVMLSELLQGIIAAAIVALIVSLCCFFYWRKIRKEKQQRHVNLDLNTVESHGTASEEQKGKHQHRGTKSEDDKWQQQERRRKLEQILHDHALREIHTIGPRLGDYKEVDLHSYTLKEAMEVVELYLAVSLDDYQEADVVQKRYVDVITGRGKHSKDGIPVIKLAVSKYLVAQGYIVNMRVLLLLQTAQQDFCAPETSHPGARISQLYRFQCCKLSVPIQCHSDIPRGQQQQLQEQQSQNTWTGH